MWSKPIVGLNRITRGHVHECIDKLDEYILGLWYEDKMVAKWNSDFYIESIFRCDLSELFIMRTNATYASKAKDTQRREHFKFLLPVLFLYKGL